MTTNFALNNYMALELKNSKDAETLANITNVIKSNFKEFKLPEEDISKDYNGLLSQAILMLKNFSNASWKNSKFLNATDIDQIKVVLKNYKNNSTRVVEFKKELIADLTGFQNQIKTNHAQKLDDYKKKHRLCRIQLAGLDAEKNALIMERLSKIVWPYDAKTKEYDNKIAKLEALEKQYARKIEDMKKTQPMANERDILLYQMHLKEQYKEIV